MSQNPSRTFSRRRELTRLAGKLELRLATYAAAASAAGVGILALAQPSAAEIIYTDTHLRVIKGTLLDLNHDGVNDFQFTGFRSVYFVTQSGGARPRYSNAALSVLGEGPDNQVFGASYASALKAGATIGPSGKFPGGPRIGRDHDKLGVSYYLRAYGPWQSNPYGIRNRYLGVKFKVNGEIHYGWVRMNVHFQPFAYIFPEITGYAYETEAGKSIRAGQTKETSEAAKISNSLLPESVVREATLGALAIGAQGIDIWRREEQASACGRLPSA
jgi:hypothetical protein